MRIYNVKLNFWQRFKVALAAALASQGPQKVTLLHLIIGVLLVYAVISWRLT